ncbi:MAG TPA: glycerol-3-phosphate dehydrogenase/oxidase [Chitinophagales bacterium]|nr:glycerol-3-phosphate dehydrogenase/oxidase [Chitinophagales bacterium]
MNFSNLNRKQFVSKLSSQQFDLLVIGGGITGCGIALDAALRGMKVALVEKNDFASGTSSRSTKLIHGGLRYLKQFEFKLVHDVGSERAIVHRNARHIVIPEKMLLPIVENGSLGAFTTSIGLMVYDLLAGVKANERRVMLDRHETHKAEPLLRFDHLLGGGLYFEYRTDDSRLVIEIAKSAFANGALLLNYAELKSFNYDNGQVTGAIVHDKISGNDFTINATVTVNACGPWVDLLRKEDNSLRGKRLQLTKGVHIVFPYEKLPLKQAAYFDVGDGRMIFAIPRNNITYVGTTDTVYNQNLDKPQCTADDARYLVNAVNKMFSGVALKLEDIVSSWAGLRPLIFEEGKSASELSRKDEIIQSPSGLISIAGGKLTGYRLMAAKITDLVKKKLGKDYGACRTKNYRLSGGEFETEKEFFNYLEEMLELGRTGGIEYGAIRNWFYRYGRNTVRLIEDYKELKGAGLAHQDALLEAELKYAVENEMIYYPQDFLVRRTGRIFFDRQKAEKQIGFVSLALAKQLQPVNNNGNDFDMDVRQEFEAATSFA